MVCAPCLLSSWKAELYVHTKQGESAYVISLQQAPWLAACHTYLSQLCAVGS